MLKTLRDFITGITVMFTIGIGLRYVGWAVVHDFQIPISSDTPLAAYNLIYLCLGMIAGLVFGILGYALPKACIEIGQAIWTRKPQSRSRLK